jgi:hypothetical protein
MQNSKIFRGRIRGPPAPGGGNGKAGKVEEGWGGGGDGEVRRKGVEMKS